MQEETDGVRENEEINSEIRAERLGRDGGDGGGDIHQHISPMGMCKNPWLASDTIFSRT